MQMTNYVGQKDVENTLHLWMGAMLCLLAMDKEQRASQAEMYKDADLDGMLVSLHAWGAEWQAVRFHSGILTAALCNCVPLGFGRWVELRREDLGLKLDLVLRTM